MALINCPECNHQVSDTAAHCVNCGAPVAKQYENRATGNDLNTVQLTSKRFKAYSLLGAALFWFGLLGTIGQTAAGSEPSGIYSLTAVAGAGLYIVTKIRVWWHHS